MSFWNANGFLIENLDERCIIMPKNFDYWGLNVFNSYPLININTPECRKLVNEQMFREIRKGVYESLEFISKKELLNCYITACRKNKLNIRILFVESQYTKEIWDGPTPKMKLLGYEYCPIPIDNQIITDLDWYLPLAEYIKKLNQYGLFDTYEDAIKFKTSYDGHFKKGEVGDGEMETFIFRISEVFAF